MKMVERYGGSCTRHFFVPLLPGFSKKLAFPTAFVKHIVEEKCSMTIATLVSPNADSWHVDVYQESMHEKIYFGGDGWLQFVHAHNLGLGYFLVFCYRGNMTFSFRAYDLSTCEITSYASADVCKEDADKDEEDTNIDNKKKITEVKVEEDQESSEDDIKGERNVRIEQNKTSIVKIEDFDEFTPKKKRKISDDNIKNQKNSDKSIHKRVMINSNYTRRIKSKSHERVKRNNWSARGAKAYFKATIWPSNLSTDYMNIPREFSDVNGLTEQQELTLIDPKGRYWKIRLSHRRIRFGSSRNCSCMSRGWQQFSVANKLNLGDKCSFELASGGNNAKAAVMKVQVWKKTV